jgi:hypothetical protein
MLRGSEMRIGSRSKRRRISAAMLSLLSAMFSCSYGDDDDEDRHKGHKKTEVVLPKSLPSST